jgi:hypothetical protein
MKTQRGDLLNVKTHKTKSKKIHYFSKIKKVDSFFDFHIKSRKHQIRGMPLVALILGFGG